MLRGAAAGSSGAAAGASLLGVPDRAAGRVRTLEGVVVAVTRDLSGVEGGLMGVREDGCGMRDIANLR